MWRKFASFIVSFIVNHPIPVILCIVVVTLGLGIKTLSLNIRALDFVKELPQNERVIQDTYYIDDAFGNQELIIVGVESENILTIENLGKIFAITREVSEIEGVIKTRIISLATFREIVITDQGAETIPLIDKLPQTQEELELLRGKILSNNLVYGKIVSPDETSTLIVVPLESGYNQKEIAESFTEIQQNYQDSATSIYLSGHAIYKESLEKGISKDLMFLLPLAFIAIFFIFILSLRRWPMVLVLLSAIAIAVAWSFGIIACAGIGITLITSAMPLIIIALGSSYGIHLILRYYDELRVVKDKKEAISRALIKTGPAILLAGITSALGFGTLYVFKILSIREFAVITAAGIMVAVFLSLIWVPAWLAIIKAPKYLEKDAGLLKWILDLFDLTIVRSLKVLARIILQYKYIVFPVVLVGPIFLAATGIPKIESRFDSEAFVPEGHRIVKVEEFLGARFDWNSRLVVMIDTGKPDTLKDSEKLLAIWQFQKEIEKLEKVSSATSFLSILEAILKDAPPDVVSSPDPLLALVIESGYFSDQITPDGRSLKIDVRIDSTDMNIVQSLEKDIQGLGSQYFGSSYSLHFSSEDLVISLMNGYIVTGKTQNMILSVILVGLFCAFVFRIKNSGLLRNFLGSFKFGFFSILPLSVSTLAIFGLMGWLGISFNMITAMISGIAVGVGVDFAIHYLHRVKDNSHLSLEEITVRAGRPIFFDALSNIAGFSVFLFSGFTPLNQLGFLMVLIMVTCSLGTILILPPLVSIFSNNKKALV